MSGRFFEKDLSRRQVLEIMGVSAGALALAACGGGNSGGSSNSSKQFNGAWPYDVPPKGTFNVVDPGAILIGGIYQDLVVPVLAMYYWKTGKWLNLMATSWSFDNGANTFTVKLRSGVKWDDGKSVTSKDLVTTLWIERINKNSLWDYIDTASATDDQTVVVHMKTPSTVVERYVLKQNLFSDAQYGQFAKRAQDIVSGGSDLTSAAGKTLAQDLQNYRPSNYTACGPFKIDTSSITNSQLTLVPNPGGLLADKVAFKKVVLYNGETPVVTPIVLQKKVDYATHGFPPATANQFAQEGIRIIRPPTYGGNGMAINYDKLPEMKDARVRQALAYAVDRKQNGQASLGASGKAVKYMVGFSDLLVPIWMQQSDISSLNTYDFNQDKAAQLLQAAGWKKNGSSWTKPDGSPAEYEILFQAEFADTAQSATDAAQQLTKFGIKVTPRSETFTQVPIDLAKGNFQLSAFVWGATSQTHPYFSYVISLFQYNSIGAGIGLGGSSGVTASSQGGKGMDFPLVQQTSKGQVDLQQLVVNAPLGLDETAQKQSVTKLAVAFNELLPVIQFHERYGNNPALEGVRVKSWPAESDPILSNAPYGDNFTIMLMYTGQLQPT